MHESGSGPEVGHEERRTELKWWGASGFAGGFIVTAVLSATILGVGLNINLGSESQVGGSDVVGLVLGERIYNTTCAACHGPTGAGNVGPALGNGVVVEKYPVLSRQIAVITDGRGAMPSFANTLTAEEIEAVAIYEREKLGQ
jgi:mono/diheme cytochrome c family protein